MSDLDEILELIASFLAAIVILLILLTWLEATMSEDYVPWGRGWFRRLRPVKGQTETLLLTMTDGHLRQTVAA
jgi:hypothetical protein